MTTAVDLGCRDHSRHRSPTTPFTLPFTFPAPPKPHCGINNVGAITSVLGPTVAKLSSEFDRRRGEEERPFVEGHPMGSRVVPTTATPDPW